MGAIEEINKAKALLDDGLINEDEFKILKAEILSKMGNISTNEDKQTSIAKNSAPKKSVKKDTQGKSLKTNEKSIPLKKRSSQVDIKVLTKSKKEKEKVEVESKS